MAWRLILSDGRHVYVDHAVTVDEAVRTAQRAFPGTTAVYAESAARGAGRPAGHIPSRPTVSAAGPFDAEQVSSRVKRTDSC